MFYLIINSNKLKFQRTVLIYFLIFSYVTTLSSCMTTSITYEKPESVKPSSCEEISKIQLKSGISVNCINKKVSLEKGNDSTYYFAVMDLIPGDQYNTTGKKQLISVNDIKKVQFSGDGLNTPSVILIVAGVLIVGAAITTALAMSQMNFGF